jgi:hypothetical protein
MKASASLNRNPSTFRPSRVLGLLLLGVTLSVVLFICWQATDKLFFFWPVTPPRFEVPQWVLAGSAAAAVIGWIVSALTTIRNSVKQHTINTLLQSRLSAVYMAHAEAVGDHFAAYVARKRLNPASARTPIDDIPKKSIGYILNYFEFIAIGIRYGDLDESVMKSSMRSMLTRTVHLVDALVQDAVAENPRAYSNLIWLYRKWRDPADEQPLNAVPSLPSVLATGDGAGAGSAPSPMQERDRSP